MAKHSHWRDAKAWSDFGLNFSSTSDESCKLYDAALTQYIGWYDDPQLGGLEKTLDSLMQADPTNIMTHVITNGLELMGTGRSPRLDPDLQKSLDQMGTLASDLSKKGILTDWEKSHVKAATLLGQGYMKEACWVWEDILLDHPLDMLAIKFAHDSYFYLGDQRLIRDSVARVLPRWTINTPLYSYLLGMHAFGLVETNFYKEAEKSARKALELNSRDAWSTHALAHVLEMEGRTKEGIGFLSKTMDDWSYCGMLACHNYWHWALYHTEKGEYDGALDIYDAEIGPRASKSGAMLDVVDACSLLYRLEMEDVSVGERWHDIQEVCRPHVDDHLTAFNDTHMLMAYLGAKQSDTVTRMMESLQTYISEGSGTNHVVTRDVGGAICRAFVAYNEGDFAKAVDIMYPVRYDVYKIGGSNAQRDIYDQFLIHAALKSQEHQHKSIARSLLMERKALKENSPLTDRLIAKCMAKHDT